MVILSIAGDVLVPTIVMRGGGASEDYLSWAVFATVAICGITTIPHAMRLRPHNIVVMGPSGAYIAVCVAAIAAGGPDLLATLTVVSSLLPLLLAARLPLFQRFLTPMISATVLMLIPLTVMPTVFAPLAAVPAGAPAAVAALCAASALLVTVGVALRTTGAWRLWAPILGVAVGSAVAVVFGLYDVRGVLEASWVGLPEGQWAGFNLEFGAETSERFYRLSRS